MHVTAHRALTPPARRGRSLLRGLAAALAGFLAAAVALGVAELVAVLVGPQSSPVVAVGGAVVDLTPRPVKEFAIRTFGESDKLALLVGTLALLTLFALAVGLVAVRRPRVGVAGVALFGVVGVVASLSRPTATVLTALPSLLGAGAGIVALLALVRTFRADSHGRASAAAAAGPAPSAPATAGPTASTVESTVDHDAAVGAATGGTGGASRATGPATSAAGPASTLRDRLLLRDRKGTAFDRRGFLLTSAATLGVAAVAGGTGRALLEKRFDVSDARDSIALPRPAGPAAALPQGVDLRLPELTPFTTDNATFYRVDTALVLPQVSPEEWSLKIHGRVGKELELSFDELLERDLIERDITLTCVSNEVGGNLVGHARWLGVPLKDLLDEVEPEDGADQVLTTSVDGWTCGTPTELCRTTEGAMLAVAMNGEPLPIAHGFPVRMIVPGLYGYVSATKWIVDMRLTSFDAVAPYWVQRKWKAKAPIKVMSRIDTPRGLSERKRGVVAVAGVAWAQTRGIAKVECRVDRGPWQQARLAAQANVNTWRQWVWEWDAREPGLHTIEARATDAAGTVQTSQRTAPFPDGATGWHSVVVTVT